MWESCDQRIHEKPRHSWLCLHIRGLGFPLPKQSVCCWDIFHADKPEANASIIRRRATGATFRGFLFIPPCFLSSLVFFSFSLSTSCSANCLINKSANTAPLKTFFPNWVALNHHARSITGTSAWLTVFYLLHRKSRQPYQRLWETFRNLLPWACSDGRVITRS